MVRVPRIPSPERKRLSAIRGREKPECPFKNGKLEIPLGKIATYSLTCDSVEIKGGEGIIGKLKHNYVNKETSVFIGVGYDLKGGIILGGGAEVGTRITFDKDGQVKDVKLESGGGVKAGTGDVYVGGKSTIDISGVEVIKAGIYAPINMNTKWVVGLGNKGNSTKE